MFFSTRFICFVDAAVGELLDQLVHRDAGVPEVEIGQGRVVVHCLAVGARRRGVDRGTLGGGEPPVASRHGEAGDQSLDVPLERPRQGLVEVVDVEDEGPVRGGVGAEVR